MNQSKSRVWLGLLAALVLLFAVACGSGEEKTGDKIPTNPTTSNPTNTNPNPVNTTTPVGNTTPSPITTDPNPTTVVVTDPVDPTPTDPVVVDQPDTTCTGIFGCAGNCGQGDQACMQDCVSKASTDAQGQFSALQTCLSDSCSDPTFTDEQFAACAESNCESEVKACGFAVGAGDKSCDDVLTCLNACPADSKTCGQDCFASGTKEAQGQFQAIVACLDTNGCFDVAEGEWQACASKCNAEFTACVGESGGGLPEPNPSSTGTANCAGTLQCLNGAADAAGVTACWDAGSYAAQQQFTAIIECGNTNCADAADNATFNTCLNQKCQSQLGACEGLSAQPSPGGGTNPGGLTGPKELKLRKLSVLTVQRHVLLNAANRIVSFQNVQFQTLIK